MNREILFRGKLIGDDSWSYGNLVIKHNGISIITPDSTPLGRYGQVMPETVGQYSGLTDKNGTKIFEGDIAKLKRFGDTCIGKIIFNQKTGGFEFWWNETVGTYGEKATYMANLSVCDDIEIIGNIHDNPELLEQEG